MNKKILVYFFLLILFLSSCNNSSNKIVSFDESSTIKNEVTTKEKNTLWTKELEPQILDGDLQKIKQISNGVALSNQNLTVINPTTQKNYPYIKEFGNLNIYNTDAKILEVVNTFSKNFINQSFSNIESQFEPGYIFNLVFFKKDLEKQYKDFTHQKYSFDKKIFNNFYIATETLSFDLASVPVRFYNNKNYLDINLIISVNNASYKIKNIEIIKWGAQ